MIRNSQALKSDLIEHDTLQGLLRLLTEENIPGGGGGAGASTLTIQKVVLVSLLNFCAYKECKAVLAKLNIVVVLNRLAIQTSDANIHKYLARIKKHFE